MSSQASRLPRYRFREIQDKSILIKGVFRSVIEQLTRCMGGDLIINPFYRLIWLQGSNL